MLIRITWGVFCIVLFYSFVLNLMPTLHPDLIKSECLGLRSMYQYSLFKSPLMCPVLQGREVLTRRLWFRSSRLSLRFYSSNSLRENAHAANLPTQPCSMEGRELFCSPHTYTCLLFPCPLHLLPTCHPSKFYYLSLVCRAHRLLLNPILLPVLKGFSKA